jgi:hypothetical protein
MSRQAVVGDWWLVADGASSDKPPITSHLPLKKIHFPRFTPVEPGTFCPMSPTESRLTKGLLFMKRMRRKKSDKTAAALMLEKLQKGEDMRLDKIRKLRAAIRRGDYLTDFKLTLTVDRVLEAM